MKMRFFFLILSGFILPLTGNYNLYERNQIEASCGPGGCAPVDPAYEEFSPNFSPQFYPPPFAEGGQDEDEDLVADDGQ